MKTNSIKSLIVSALFTLAIGSTMAAESTLQFSDPSQPGRLVVRLAFGDVEVAGEDTDEVTVRSEVAVQGEEQPREDGLRRLDADGGFSMSESKNTITLSFGWFGMGGRHGSRKAASDVAITVPRATAVTIERGGMGDIAIRNLTGDVEIRGAVGEVDLVDVAGGLLLESTNGDINATFSELPESKPVSVTVVNGDVDMKVPADARANVRLRTLHGEMLTDFSEEEFESRFENTKSTMPNGAIQSAMRTAVVAQEAVANAFAAATAVTASSNLTAEEAAQQQEQARKRHAQLQHLQEERRAALERRKAIDEAAKNEKTSMETPDAVASPLPAPAVGSIEIPMPLQPKLPNLPPMAGGKLVVGTLNGGGTELLITTLTGTITLRKRTAEVSK